MRSQCGRERPYFASQSELLAFAMRLVVERIEDRIAALDRLTDGLALHTALRPELMPPEGIVAVLRLHLDALDREADPAAPTASA